jgi:hypothetical protein
MKTDVRKQVINRLQDKYEYDCSCDMGSMKIMLEGGSIFFSNDVGDCDFKVIICEESKIPRNRTDFKGHFTLFKEGWLMAYDCSVEEYNKLHTFEKGRYFVYLDKKDGTTFYIHKADEDTHA